MSDKIKYGNVDVSEEELAPGAVRRRVSVMVPEGKTINEIVYRAAKDVALEDPRVSNSKAVMIAARITERVARELKEI